MTSVAEHLNHGRPRTIPAGGTIWLWVRHADHKATLSPKKSENNCTSYFCILRQQLPSLLRVSTFEYSPRLLLLHLPLSCYLTPPSFDERLLPCPSSLCGQSHHKRYVCANLQTMNHRKLFRVKSADWKMGQIQPELQRANKVKTLWNLLLIRHLHEIS